MADKTVQLTIKLANTAPDDTKFSIEHVRGDDIYALYECTDIIEDDIMTVTAIIAEDDQIAMDECEQFIEDFNRYFATARR